MSARRRALTSETVVAGTAAHFTLRTFSSKTAVSLSLAPTIVALPLAASFISRQHRAHNSCSRKFLRTNSPKRVKNSAVGIARLFGYGFNEPVFQHLGHKTEKVLLALCLHHVVLA